jgi:hypothetical protein
MERANVRKRLQGVFLRCPELAEKDLRVFNVSELGVGVETAPIALSPEVGKVIEAKLLVGRTSAPVGIRLVHMTTEMTGFEFVNPSDLVRGAIRNYFENELVGASLRPVEGSGTAKGLCYADDQGNRLELEVSGKRIQKFSFCVMGNQVEWVDGGQILLLQNARREPAPESLLKQLIKLVQSADFLDRSTQQGLERLLQKLPQETG